MFGQKFLDRKHCARRYVVMVQDPLVGEQFWPHTMNPLSQTSQNLKIKTSGWQFDQMGQTLSALSLCHQRNKPILSWLFILTPALSWVRVIWRFPLHALPLVSGYIQKNPAFTLSDDSVQPSGILLNLLQKISANFPLSSQMIVTEVTGHHLCTNFPHP